MSSARIYFMPFASKNPPEQVQEGLTRAGGFLRGEVGAAAAAAACAAAEFVFDDSIEQAAQL